MLILGISLSGPNAAAALLHDQTLVAACDNACLARLEVHGAAYPWLAARECLRQAGLEPHQVDAVAIADAGMQVGTAAFWHQLSRQWQAAPVPALLGLVSAIRQQQKTRAGWAWMLQQLGINAATQRIQVERTLALTYAGIVAAGHPADTCVLSCNDTQTPTAALFGKTHNGQFEPLSEIAQPDSLLQVMRCMGAYLGFEPQDALEGIALLARHGDPDRYSLNRLCTLKDGAVQINLTLLTPDSGRGWQHEGKRYPFTQKLVDWLGPPAAESPALDPHAHYAAALQRHFWQTLLQYFSHHLGSHLKQTPSVLLCGDAALARHVPSALLEQSGILSLQRSPFTGNTGAAIGAAAYVAARHGILVDRLEHPFFGPDFLQEECIAACRKHPTRPKFEIIRDPAKKAARLIAEGHAIGWLQGRAETGPLSLGARTILQSPTREQRPLPVAKAGSGWSEVCKPVLSISAAHVHRYTDNNALDAFATTYVALPPDIREWLPKELQIDGYAPLQRVDKAFSPRLYHLLEELEKISGHGMVLQLPMQSDGEPAAYSPHDALDWFAASEAKYLIMEDVLVSKMG